MKKTTKLAGLTLALLLVFPYEAMAYKVVVDPGHGGKDPGAIGVNGLNEKTVNLDVSLKLRDELKKKGVEVVMTRSDDRYLSLDERVQFTNAQNADVFVSVHANSNPSSTANGSQVLYYDSRYPQDDYPASPEMEALTPSSKLLAQKVLSSVLSQTGLKDQGLVPSAVYVVRKGKIPSILVETGFLSNKKKRIYWPIRRSAPKWQKRSPTGSSLTSRRFSRILPGTGHAKPSCASKTKAGWKASETISSLTGR